MRGGGGKQIIEEPHAAGEVGSGEDPTAAQAAQAVNFGEAARDDERIFVGARDGIANGKAKRRVLVKKHFEIDLVDQDMDTSAMGQFADGLKHFLGEKRAARIVQIGEHDKPRGGSDGALKFVEADGKARLEAARKALHTRAEIVHYIEQRAVGGLLEEHFVAGLENGGHGKVIGHGSARGSDDAFFGYACVASETLLQRPIAVAAGSGDFKFVEVDGKFGARNANEAAGGQIVFCVRMRLGPFHVERAFSASGAAHAVVASRFLARQKKYTGKPARAMARPMEERRGSRTNVLMTTSHSAAMKSSVVQGWPGTP